MLHSKEKVKPPRNLRSARRSLVKNQISTPVNLPANVLLMPKKIIKALYDYQAQGPHELSFSRGDFFHVIGRENDERWFEACNPATNSKGLVPVHYFQILDKSERNLTMAAPQKADSGFLDADITAFHSNSSNKRTQQQPLYGVVLYDFKAERSDELDARAGEPIIVIAQSNLEWFVAKPIGRLGGPGLIPVSFVEVRDAVTGKPITNLLQASPMIPRVEEWKKMTQGYEASSITLASRSGFSDSPSSSISSATSGARPPHPQQSIPDHHGHDNRDSMLDAYGLQHLAHDTPQMTESRPERSSWNDSRGRTEHPMVVAATIDSYILEGDQYWFIVYAHLNNGRHRVLYRLYEDFYDFQINVLAEYPVEAGKADRERILPYMPGPLTEVDETITAERQRDLDKYCYELLNLPRYLAESSLVQNLLFGIHEGDIETEYDPRLGIPGLEDGEEEPIVEPVPSASAPLRPPPSLSAALSAPMVTPSATTSTPRAGAPAGGTVKLKIVHKDDIFAIKVPADSTLEQLHIKVRDRLGFPVSLRYKGDAAGNSLPLENEVDMEEAFASAIKLGKLTVYAERI